MPFSARLAKIILILCFLPAAAVTGAMAQSGPDEGLRRDVEFLSDSLCTGRKTGTAGSSAASFYIIHHLRSLGYEVRVEAFGTSSGAVGHNIIGFKPGFTGRALLLMAPYDGLGKIGGRFYPGADSNASGTAALLSLAERFKDRSDLVLAFVDGHMQKLAQARELHSQQNGAPAAGNKTQASGSKADHAPLSSERSDPVGKKIQDALREMGMI